MDGQDNLRTLFTDADTTPHLMHIGCWLELSAGVTRQSFGR